MTSETSAVDGDALSIGGFTVSRREVLLYLISGAQGLELLNLSIVNIARGQVLDTPEPSVVPAWTSQSRNHARRTIRSELARTCY